MSYFFTPKETQSVSLLWSSSFIFLLHFTNSSQKQCELCSVLEMSVCQCRQVRSHRTAQTSFDWSALCSWCQGGRWIYSFYRFDFVFREEIKFLPLRCQGLENKLLEISDNYKRKYLRYTWRFNIIYVTTEMLFWLHHLSFSLNRAAFVVNVETIKVHFTGETSNNQ